MSGLAKLSVTPKLLVIVLLATLLILAGATWFLVITPKKTQANSLDAQITAAKEQLFTRTHLPKEPKGLNPVLEGTLVNRALPDTIAMPQVVLELSRISGEEHVTITSLTPVASTVYASFSETPLTVTVTGKFFAVEAFLRELRNQVRLDAGQVVASGRLFDVQGVNINQGSKPPLVTANVSLDVFNYTEPVTSTPAPSTPAPGA